MEKKRIWQCIIGAIVIFKVVLLLWWTRNHSNNKSEAVLTHRFVSDGFREPINNEENFTSIEIENKFDSINITVTYPGEEIETVPTQANGFLDLNLDETFRSIKYEHKMNCIKEVNQKEPAYGRIFVVISGFNVSSQIILSARNDSHFILVAQENDISDVDALKHTVEKTWKMTDESTFNFIFCRDYLDNNFNQTIYRISQILTTKFEEKGLKGVIYLDTESQFSLFLGISRLLQGNHISRKNLGYLMAIALGAEFIIDLNGAHNLIQPDWLSRKGLKTAFKNNSKHPVIATLHSDVNNPYVLMGPRTNPDEKLDYTNAMKNIWPRGYPSSELIRKEVPTFHLLEEIETRLSKQASSEDCFHFSNDIIQSIVDERPDVDSEYENGYPLPITFLPQFSRISIHPSQFAPFSAHATIFSRRAFWALLLPASVGDAVSDIWRGYIAQTFLHCTGSLLSFSTPIVKQVYEKYLDTNNRSQDETSLSSRVLELIEFLSVYDCSRQSPRVNVDIHNSLPYCMIVLYSKLVSRGFLEGEKDISLIHEWIKALISLDYLFPNFYPSNNCLAKRDRLYQPSWNFTHHSFCEGSINSTTPSGQRECGNRLLTVVHINYGHKEVIPIWLAQWQYIYINPIFYISDKKEKINSGSCMLEPTDYFNVACNEKDHNGQMSYESMINALGRYPDYDNYLFIHDDAYISHKTLHNVIADGVSMISECEFITLSKNWMWVPRIEKSMKALWLDGNFQQDSFYRKITGKYCPELYANESKVAEIEFLFHFTMSDVFILTKSDIETFLIIMNKYLDVEMYLEAAIPMTLLCALNAREIEYKSFWDWRRGDIDVNQKLICNSSNAPVILHPIWKISHSDKNDEDWWEALEKYISIRYCDFVI